MAKYLLSICLKIGFGGQIILQGFKLYFLLRKLLLYAKIRTFIKTKI